MVKNKIVQEKLQNFITKLGKNIPKNYSQCWNEEEDTNEKEQKSVKSGSGDSDQKIFKIEWQDFLDPDSDYCPSISFKGYFQNLPTSYSYYTTKTLYKSYWMD